MSAKIYLSAVIAAFAITTVPAFADDWLHSVRPGDTIWDLCLELTEEPLCWQKLPRLNPEVVNVRRMPPGSQIKIPVEWLKNPPVPAEVEYVQGQASVYREDEITAGELKAGDKLNMGDRISTTQGTVLLRFADGSSFLLKTNSEVVLERLSAHGETGMVDTHIKLHHGTGRAKVKKRNGSTRYKISTPTAIATARGTEYSVSSDGSLVSRSEVLEGIIGVESTASSGAQAVNQGYGTLVEKGKPAEAPRKLLPAVKIDLPVTTPIPFTLHWQALDKAQQYNVDIYQGVGTGRLLRTETTTTNSLDLLALSDDHYRFAIRAIDDVGLKGIEASASTDAKTQLSAPILLAENIVVKNDNMSLTWPALDHVKSYQVQVSKKADFSSTIFEDSVTQAQFEGTLPNTGTYYVRIRSHYSDDRNSDFSETAAFNNDARNLWLLGLQALAMLAVILL